MAGGDQLCGDNRADVAGTSSNEELHGRAHAQAGRYRRSIPVIRVALPVGHAPRTSIRTAPSIVTSAPNVTSPSTSSFEQCRSDGAPAGNRGSKSGRSLKCLGSRVTIGAAPSKVGESPLRPDEAHERVGTNDQEIVRRLHGRKSDTRHQDRLRTVDCADRCAHRRLQLNDRSTRCVGRIHSLAVHDQGSVGAAGSDSCNLLNACRSIHRLLVL